MKNTKKYDTLEDSISNCETMTESLKKSKKNRNFLETNENENSVSKPVGDNEVLKGKFIPLVSY